MKKTLLTTTIILTFLLTSTVAVAQLTEIRNENLSGFTKVYTEVPGKINIRIGAEFKVVMEGEQDYLANIETIVSEGKLIIRDNRKYEFKKVHSNNGKFTANITMPAISGLTISSFGNIEVFDSFKTDSLSLELDGLGKLILNDVSGEYLNCEISGAGRIIIQGNGFFKKANVDISGVGRYVGESLKLETANVNISGLGNCYCFVSDALKARISGIGRIENSGLSKVDKKISGIGFISSY